MRMEINEEKEDDKSSKMMEDESCWENMSDKR